MRGPVTGPGGKEDEMEKIKKLVKCDRCGGRGFYAVGVHNGQLVIARPDNGVCYKCEGSGMMQVTEIIRTPEEQARYERAKARREAKARAKREAEEAARKEAQRIAEEARLEAERQRIANLHRGYAGDIGSKIDTIVTALYSASFEVESFRGYGTTTMKVYAFEDDQRRLIVWKTTACCTEFEVGQKFRLTGTVKAHNVYRDEEQTIVTRPKITRIAE